MTLCNLLTTDAKLDGNDPDICKPPASTVERASPLSIPNNDPILCIPILCP